MSNARKVFSEDEIRTAVNENDPREAFVIAITLLQRFTCALEKIADQGDAVGKEPPPFTGTV